MYFEDSSTVTLLFNFWNVNGPAGMVLSVCVVLLLTVLYEFLKVWKVTLGRTRNQPTRTFSPPDPSCLPAVMECQERSSALESSPSEISLAPAETTAAPADSKAMRWLVHGLQTFIHVLQVTLGYMLMLCVMSYNVWVFVGVVVGSVLGYFLAFPLLNQV